MIRSFLKRKTEIAIIFKPYKHCAREHLTRVARPIYKSPLKGGPNRPLFLIVLSPFAAPAWHWLRRELSFRMIFPCIRCYR